MRFALTLAVFPLARKRGDGFVDVLGTCFAVSPTAFATAAHVAGPSDLGLCIILKHENFLTEYQDTTIASFDTIDIRLAAYDPIRDIAVLKLSEGTSMTGAGYELDSTDNIPPGTTVISYGFPHADAGRFVLTLQASMVGARVYLGEHGIKTKHAVLNTQTRPGQSGGPIVSADGRRIHAIVIGGYAPPGAYIVIGRIDPRVLHQTTHAVPAEYVREMLQ